MLFHWKLVENITKCDPALYPATFYSENVNKRWDMTEAKILISAYTLTSRNTSNGENGEKSLVLWRFELDAKTGDFGVIGVFGKAT